MDRGVILFFVFLCCFFVTLIIYTIVCIKECIEKHKSTLTKYVKETSCVLKKLEEINNKYNFKQLDSCYTYYKKFNSLNSYTNVNMDKMILDIIHENIVYINNYISFAAQNSEKFPLYKQDVEKLKQELSDDFWDSNKKKDRLFCINAEKEIFNQNIIYPITEISICVIKTYSSPKGRNHYNYPSHLSQNKIIEYIEKCVKKDEYKQTSQYQRSLLTPSMRYDILKRDGFRCVICGASAENGISLEVDHIVPIARGGKTEPNNLRTLCHNCNAGKRDKYDPQGTN